MDTPESKIKLVAEADVLVVGGGLAGCVAAVRAAREGARVALVDTGGPFGGLETNGLQSIFGCQRHDAEGRALLAGTQEELIERLVRRGGCSSRWREPEACLAYDEQCLKLVLGEMIAEAKVMAMNHTFASTPVVDSEKNIGGLVVQNKTGREMIRAVTTIDATSEAAVASRVGCSMRARAVRGELGFKLGSVDMERLYEHIVSGVRSGGDVLKPPFFVENWQRQGVLHCGIQIARGQARWLLMLSGMKGSGELVAHRETVSIDSLSPLIVTKEQIRQQLESYEILRAIRDIPGFEKASITFVASQMALDPCGGIDGEACASLSDEAKGQASPLASVISTIDSLVKDGLSTKLPRDVPVPFGAIVPKGVQHLLVADPRAVCSSPAELLVSHSSAALLGDAAAVGAVSAPSGRASWALSIGAIHKRMTELGYNGLEG
jgi:hypothetical protein